MQTTTNRQRRSGSSVSRNNSGFRGTPRRPFSKTKRTFGKRNASQHSAGGFRARNNGRNTKKVRSFDPSQFIHTNPTEQHRETFVSQHQFNTFGLDARIVERVHALGITAPTAIQDSIIPCILAGKDVIGLSETGTGKTAAFLLPLIHKTLHDQRRMTLVVTPTRELALQIDAELRTLSQGMKIYSTVCVGGANIGTQIRNLRRSNHFVIGTPGRILDLIKRRNLKLDTITTVVLDEADRMLDMGFIHDIRAIVKAVPKDRETLFFSATIDKNTESLINEFLRTPITISVKKSDVTNSIAQDVVRHRDDNKFETLLSLLAGKEFSRVIVFGAMKHRVQKLAEDLCEKGIRSESIHGNKSHGQRQRALSSFKGGRTQVLVATDVAARGIHVDDVSHVINYDLPNTFEDYVHRIGRTGRGDKRGKALTFIRSENSQHTSRRPVSRKG